MPPPSALSRALASDPSDRTAEEWTAYVKWSQSQPRPSAAQQKMNALDATAKIRAEAYRARTMAADAELGRTIDMLDSFKDAGYGLSTSTEMKLMDMAVNPSYYSSY